MREVSIAGSRGCELSLFGAISSYVSFIKGEQGRDVTTALIPILPGTIGSQISAVCAVVKIIIQQVIRIVCNTPSIYVAGLCKSF